MTATTTSSQDFDVQILEETVQGAFQGGNAFMGSILQQQGAVMVSDTMPNGRIGEVVTVPYFGNIGEFQNNPEDTASVPSMLKTTNETASVGRQSLSFEVTEWARGSSPPGTDPYEEATRQISVAATRAMDKLTIAAAAGTDLVHDVYSSTTPAYINYDRMVDALALYGDEDNDIVAMVTHSRVMADMRKLKDGAGRPLLIDSAQLGGVTRFLGVPVLVSDRVTLDGSTMGSVTESGTSPPDIAFTTNTPLQPFNLRIRVGTAGARGSSTIEFSTDGGMNYSAPITTAASIALVDTNPDSKVGVHGQTGLVISYENASSTADNVWTATANIKATTLLCQRGSLAFWYNRDAMRLKTDEDILKDNDVAAMHLYYVAHRYRRRNGGSRSGVVALKTNVGGFVG